MNPSISSSSSNTTTNESAGNFECNICLELAQDPVITLCGHLYCWPCLYKWLRVETHTPNCPVCKALIEESKLVPLYGRGKNPTDPRTKPVPNSEQIPHRPTGQRPPTAPQPDPNGFQNQNPNPFGFVGGVPVGNIRWGNYNFTTAFGLFPMFGLQFNNFPGYGPGVGYPHGYANPVHGVHGHGFRYNVPQGQHTQDQFLKVLLIAVGFLVVASLIMF
ncbi:hypothetical protein LUZ60_004989 [Juncus effusus]|nr:hypothetical protein LUZ60_004989 [Juncus effusus]